MIASVELDISGTKVVVTKHGGIDSAKLLSKLLKNFASFFSSSENADQMVAQALMALDSTVLEDLLVDLFTGTQIWHDKKLVNLGKGKNEINEVFRGQIKLMFLVAQAVIKENFGDVFRGGESAESP